MQTSGWKNTEREYHVGFGGIMNIFKKAKSFLCRSPKTVLILLLLLSLLVSAVGAVSLPTKRKTSATLAHSVQLSELLIVGYTVEGNSYSPLGEDPQIHIPVVSDRINDVSVQLSSPLPAAVTCQLFYAANQEGLSEANSVLKTFEKGQKELYFSLPSDVYTALRLDINGAFEISTLTLSEMQSVKAYKSLHVDWSMFFVCLVALSTVVLIVFALRKKITRAYLFVKQRFFSEDSLASLSEKRDRRIERFFLMFSTVVCLLLIFIIPPLTVPDEIAHFLNVLKVSHFNFFPIVKDGVMGTYLSTDEIAFIADYSDVMNTSMDIRNILGTAPAYAPAVTFYESNLLYINPFAYVLPGFGIAIARLLLRGIDVYSLFLLARTINAAFYVAVTYWALRVTPIFKKTMFLLALMPMTLHQCASTSYDALIIPAAFLLFAYATKILLKDNSYRIGLVDTVAIALASGVLFATKYAYIVLLLIMLSISIKKFGSIKKYFACIGLIALIGGVFFLIPTAINSSILSAFPKSEMEIAYAEYFKQNVFITKDILRDTTAMFWKSWVAQFVGVFGWLNIHMPIFFTILYVCVLSVTVATEAAQIKGITFKTRLLSYAGYAIFFVGTIIALYLQHTSVIGIPVGRTISYGFQGRYLIPAIPFLFLVFSNPLLTRFKYLKNLNRITEKLAVLTSVIFSLLTIFILTSAYWM